MLSGKLLILRMADTSGIVSASTNLGGLNAALNGITTSSGRKFEQDQVSLGRRGDILGSY